MSTAKGDSGSPLIVQPKGLGGECYVIGMHCSGKYDKSGYKFKEDNTAVLITKIVLEQLGKM